MEALQREKGCKTVGEATEVLKGKGYFTPRPRPWNLGVLDRGMGRMNWAVLDRFGDLVVKADDRETAELIISAVNAHSKSAIQKGK